MYTRDFVVSVLTKEGKVVDDKGKGEITLKNNSEFSIRLRNKHRLNCVCDVYVNEERINETGLINVFGNDFVDLLAPIRKDGKNIRFKTSKKPITIEARFYLQEDKQNDTYGIPYKPVYIYPVKSVRDEYIIPNGPWCISSNHDVKWFPREWCIGGTGDYVQGEIITATGSVPVQQMIDAENKAMQNMRDGEIYVNNGIQTSPDGFVYTSTTQGINIEKEPTILKIKIKVK